MDTDDWRPVHGSPLGERDDQSGLRRTRHRAWHGKRRREGADVGMGARRSRIEAEARHLLRAGAVPYDGVDERQPRATEHEEAQQECTKQGQQGTVTHQLR